MSIELGAGGLFVDGQFVGDISNVQLGSAPAPAAIADTPSVTVDAKGSVIGDTSHIDPHILAQLSTPQVQEQIRGLYRSSRYEREQPREVRYFNDGERRDFSHLRPAGMDAKQFKRLRKQTFRNMTKATIATQRSLRNG